MSRLLCPDCIKRGDMLVLDENMFCSRCKGEYKWISFKEEKPIFEEDKSLQFIKEASYD